MDQLLDFIDHFSLDERLYWQVPTCSGTECAELSWERKGLPTSWKFKLPGGEWRAIRASELAAMLNEGFLDGGDLRRQIGASALTQAAFASMVMDGARKIFGDDAVEKSIIDTKIFLETIREIAESMTAGTARSNESATPGRVLKLV